MDLICSSRSFTPKRLLCLDLLNSCFECSVILGFGSSFLFSPWWCFDELARHLWLILYFCQNCPWGLSTLICQQVRGKSQDFFGKHFPLQNRESQLLPQNPRIFSLPVYDFVCLHLLAILTGQGYISEVSVLYHISKGRNHIVLEIIPVQAELFWAFYSLCKI